ncbi:MAG: glycosyltransferase family 9 protein [Candidatus Omnitrophica bacterium]|nr:glycosyltransferase family 9 protein [Candidatus Omnitrophota bacterium]
MPPPNSFDQPNRLLIVRLDRIGDVVLTTPVIQRLREAYPTAFIAMMVRPACRELLEGNPSLNEVISYDKDGRHHSWWSTIRFAWGLRHYQFDTAIVVHPTRRSHWIIWLAGIPRRIGYHRKDSWLLTHRLPHRKQEGSKHEAEYAMELLQVLGLEASQTLRPFVPVASTRAQEVDQRLAQRGIKAGETLVAVHPSASCLSKRWMPDRFAQVADQLIETYGVRVVLIAGSGDDARNAEAVERAMRHRPINMAGQLSVGELAALLKRCRLLISNDSGPVHVAAALGIPGVALFGRAQPGVNAARWRPLGPRHVVLDKSGPSRFTSIDELTIEEVYAAATSLLS